MSVLGFPASAAARNFQDLSHIFRDFRRPVPLSFARMEIVSRTAPRPVGLMRVAGLTPLVACLGRAGAPLTRLCHELVDAIDGERRQAREYRSSLAMKLIGLAAGPSDDIQRREAAVSFPVSLLGRAVPPLSGQRTDDDIAAWEASAPAADFPGSVLQVIETLSFAHQAR